jgi:hypothetical protein
MPQQLKQFVENSKKQKEYKSYDFPSGNTEGLNHEKSGTETDAAAYDAETDFGKHFLMNTVSSDDEKVEEKSTTAVDMSLHE